MLLFSLTEKVAATAAVGKANVNERERLIIRGVHLLKLVNNLNAE